MASKPSDYPYVCPYCLMDLPEDFYDDKGEKKDCPTCQAKGQMNEFCSKCGKPLDESATVLVSFMEKHPVDDLVEEADDSDRIGICPDDFGGSDFDDGFNTEAEFSPEDPGDDYSEPVFDSAFDGMGCGRDFSPEPDLFDAEPLPEDIVDSRLVIAEEILDSLDDSAEGPLFGGTSAPDFPLGDFSQTLAPDFSPPDFSPEPEMVECAFCANSVSADLESCPHCGGEGSVFNSLFSYPKEKQEEKNDKKCPDCDYIVSEEDIICMACGMNLLNGQKITEDEKPPRNPGLVRDETGVPGEFLSDLWTVFKKHLKNIG